MQKLDVGKMFTKTKSQLILQLFLLRMNSIFCGNMRSNGGEDYELLFTIKQSDYDKLKDDPDFTVIGHITDKSTGTNFVAKDGTVQELLRKVGVLPQVMSKQLIVNSEGFKSIEIYS